jgi:murein DD-endopeptidase MepM/ murein hydrolase activator NlpD
LVVAPEDGKITKLPAEDSKGNVKFDNRGLFIEFTSSDGNRVHKFFHLKAIGEESIVGASFSKGKALAKSGGKEGAYGAGNAKGAGHLHWEVWVEGKPENPMNFFKKNEE